MPSSAPPPALPEQPASKLALRIAALTTLIGIMVTVALGIWQVQRLTWKEHLLARIEARIDATPVGIDEAWQRAEAGEDIAYLRTKLSGAYLEGRDLYLYAIGKAGPGVEVVSPLRLADGRIVLVNRGYAPDAAISEIAPARGEVTIVGLARLASSKSWFTPDNDTRGNRWYWRDIKGMAHHLAAQDVIAPGQPVASFIIDQEGDGSSAWPRPGATRLSIPNNHLQYAVTWFSFAIVLAVIFVIWRRNQQRLTLAPKSSE